jgi:lysophospholipase L1-like esterase
LISKAALAGLLLSPVLLVEAAWVIARAERLPEPSGPRVGKTGNGAPLRLLILGDSSAAGVGVTSQSDALASQLAHTLGAKNRQVTWRLCARNGATSANAKALLSDVKDQSFDVALVVFGVNDVKNMRRLATWRKDIATIIETLKNDHATRHIFFSGLPPMASFPLLPWPLNSFLGDRAARFEDALVEQIETEPKCHVLSIDLPLETSLMASDGFHPGQELYAIWAQEIAVRMDAVLG